jgi:hypothetical protein
MASGIFLIGKQTDLEIYQDHIKPNLETNGVTPLDAMKVPTESYSGTVLISISTLSLSELESKSITQPQQSCGVCQLKIR